MWQVERDLLMDAYDKQYPMYGFAQHKARPLCILQVLVWRRACFSPASCV